LSTALGIRPATEADVSAITAIYRHYVLTHPATFEIDPPDETEMTARLLDVFAAALPYWVAERDAAVVGYCYVTPYRPRPAYRHTLENSIYIAPDSTGMGIGRALLQQVLEVCSADGYREVVAVIGDSQNQSSIALHQRAGFVHVGTLRNVGFKLGRWLDTVIMQRTLENARR
jgi:L-amino acid N-acyltransferase YncA